MSKKAIHIGTNEKLEDIITKGGTAGTKFQADANADIQAKGVTIAGKTTTASNKKTAVRNAEIALATAVSEQTTAEDELVEAFNLGVDKANEVYPHNETKLTGLGLTLSKDAVSVPLCEKPTGCSVVQSEHSGKANMHCNPVKHARDYRVMETTDAATLDETKYYPANPTSFDNSKGGEVIPKTLNVTVWWRIYGHNASGDGVWSEPFGGFPIH